MSDFNWVEGTTTVAQIVKSLAIDLTTAAEHNWSCKNPANVGGITNKVILETETSFGSKFYLKIERPEGVLNYVLLTLGNKYNTETEDIDEAVSNEPARFAWYRLTTEVELFEWAGIQYWLSFSEDFINVVLQGDPSLDVAPYKNYLISYGYIGSLESFDGGDSDTTHNFGITVSSDVFPEETSSKYGVRTASCITDVGMIGTRTGTPFQAHLPKFSTSWEYADRNFISSSQWTHKYHMSDIILLHAYDRERGKLKNVLIGDRSAIFHLDVLVIDKGLETQKEYVMFNINAPYSILNNGPNVLYGIAIRKS